MADRATDGTSALKRPGRFTYRDYKTWPADERWELINGEAYAMSPAPRRVHQTVLAKMYVQIDAHFAGKRCRPHIAPVDVFLVEEGETVDNAEHVVQPDAFVVCDEKKLAENGVIGAPDLVIEVLSPATAMKDQSEKRTLYEKHGVREYWIINPDTFELFAYTLTEGRFPLPAVADLRDGFTSTIFPDLTVRVRPEDL